MKARHASRAATKPRSVKQAKEPMLTFRLPKRIQYAEGQEFKIVPGQSSNYYEFSIRDITSELDELAQSDIDCNTPHNDPQVRDTEVIYSVGCLKGAKAIVQQWEKDNKLLNGSAFGEFSGTLARQMRAECKRRKITPVALLLELIRSYRRNAEQARRARN